MSHRIPATPTDNTHSWLQAMTATPAGTWGHAAWSYTVDAWQRTVLYANIRRQRGNQYRAHLQEQAPHVLSFAAETVLSGLDLPQPVNYMLSRILPQDTPSDPGKRPFIVVDPRAGHGPGIGGFKPDSEIGAALQAGHPCYFVGFLPDPVAGQSVEDVMRAEAAFVRRVAELHPDSGGKPVVIGNCQAGWQVLMTAAVWPELFGPIILAGAPLSYWAGDNPMRYAGGLTGGSWLTALTSDLGAGRFDGAWLVQNFERLDPAHTLWSKQYNVYAKVDSEGPRYLGFEKYWGGYVFLDGGEMQYIVDNLFIGNKLATAELCTSDGVRIDLRNIRSPVVVFSSFGDNITPPAQALGWITDLYRDDADVVAHDQTIVFATHDSIGHLGIFVSASVGRKEHRKFAANIELIDLLPAGIYRAEVDELAQDACTGELLEDPYLMRIRPSNVEEVRAIVQPDADSERRFAAAARLSEVNLALYRNLWQPWIQAWVTPHSADWLQALHPMRIGYEWWSDAHPLARGVQHMAESIRANRHVVDANNPFWLIQQQFSAVLEQALDSYRDTRDSLYALSFDALYGSPLLQALAGQSSRDTQPVRPHPGDSPEHRAFLQHELDALEAGIHSGGLPEAMMRSVCYIFAARGEADERHFHHAWNLLQPHIGRHLPGFRTLARRQALLMRHHSKAALAAIPQLLASAQPQQVKRALQLIAALTEPHCPLVAEEKRRKQEVEALFTQGIERSTAAMTAERPPTATPRAESADNEEIAPQQPRNTRGRKAR